MRRNLILVAVLAGVLSPLSAQTTCSVRSGVDVTTGIPVTGGLPFTAADFLAASTGATLPIVTPFPGWTVPFPCDPTASWIGTPSGGGGSGLLTVPFPCPLTPCTSALLTVCLAVDNDLGDLTREGLYFNGTPLVGSKLLGGIPSHFTTPTTWSFDVSNSIVSGANSLSLFVVNASGASGVRYTASLTLGSLCTVRSGVDTVRSTALPPSGSVTANDFLAAANGPPLVTMNPIPGWAVNFPCDPQAQWLSVPAPGNNRRLLSVDFPCNLPPCADVLLCICFAVDNDLGDALNEGVWVNGSPVPGTKLLGGAPAHFTTPTTWTALNVTGMVHGGTNTLQLLVQNFGGACGIRFSATLMSPNFSTITPLCVTSGPLPNVIPPMSGANPLDPFQRNNDGSSGPIPLGFDFCIGGMVFNDVYINNNGNVTFGAPLAASSGAPFPLAGPKMIAPFWADVDTRNPATGNVWYTYATPSLFVVTWERVGYFNQHGEKQNTFQLLLSDGTDPTVGIGNNVCFCYGCMEWTTGDASSGSNGFGGLPAIVGINHGDGINAIEVGRFDHAGSDYDGSAGNNDGVSWLDGRVICFALPDCCGPIGVPGLSDLTVNGFSPGSGSGQTVTVAVPGVVVLGVSTLPGSTVTLMYSLNCLCPGIYTPFGEFNLDPTTLGVLIDGCGVFGPPDPFGFTATGNLVAAYPLPPSFAGLCVCVQALVCHPVFSPLKFTQSYRVCFQ